MRLVVPLSNNDIAARSYDLFHVIMKALASPAHPERKWEASRLALHGAYKSDRFLPPVKDPQPILAFLSHHFELVEDGKVHDEPIQDALRALAYDSTPETIEALKNFETRPSFVHGICHVFQEGKPLQLRKAALFFLPLIADKWFNTRRPFTNDNEIKRLCVGWASAVDEVWGTDDVCGPTLALLLDMINCPHWRPHVVPEKWKLLEHFDSVPDDSQPLARCLKIFDQRAVASGFPTFVIASTNSGFLLFKYNQLDPAVQGRLEASVRGPQRTNADSYLLMIQSKLDEAEKQLLGYGTWATAPEAVVLKGKIDSLKAAIEFLKSVKRGYR